jgi:hypothetical protein
MSITAFIGTIDEDDSPLPITGNGKTLGVVGFSYLDYLKDREIWSNFWTDYSAKIIGFQTMIDLVKQNVEEDTVKPNLVLIVTEMRKILDAIGSSQEQILYIDDFAEQIRKLDCALYYDTQRFNSIHKRLRIHTNTILIPYKTHMDDSACYLPSCMKPHKIYIYSHKPEIEKPIKCFNSIVVGGHYNTKEFCKDKLVLPKKIKGVY